MSPIRRCFLLALATPAIAFAQVPPPPENVLSLSASATVEAVQDELVVVVQLSREGADAVQVQAQLKAALEQALAEARRAIQPGVQVASGGFNVSPRLNRDGRITAWFGTAELVVEGSDTARVAQLAGRLPGTTVRSAGFRLSRAAQEQAEKAAQAQAVAAFRGRAAELAKAFGFAGWSLREVNVSGGDAVQPQPRFRMQAAAAAPMAADAPLPVEAGRSSVAVTVSGSVQLR